MIGNLNVGFPSPTTKGSIDLSPLEADLLVHHQLAQPQLQYLSPIAFSAAKIVDNESTSVKIHKALTKNGILGLPSEPNATPVTTTAITRSFAHQLAFVSAHVQRRLVALLFFWEEECARFRMLDEEEAALLHATSDMPTEPLPHELQVQLEAIRQRRRLLPSQRAEDTPNVARGVREVLPAYE
ncbi:hypothetical protein M8818_000826 [Zalaria obscura]|uniref:Uncharacterized protein n=1 Tax=Zalaria obscura TaxID=2024903 RepID=A0ACC3SN16_9PEZI